MSQWLRRALISLPVLLLATPAAAQTFEIVGTRAAGMGGAFVAVADDASATYWNPGGLALGRLFSVVLDRSVDDVNAHTLVDPSRHNTGTFFGLGLPALGLSYYQLRTTSA